MAFNEKMEQAIQVSTKQSTFCRETGTAEVFQDGESRVNSTYIGYAPINNLNYHFNCLHQSTRSTTMVKWRRFR